MQAPVSKDPPKMAFPRDLFTQVFSDRARIQASEYGAYNGFLGVLLLGGALILCVSAPPDRLGPSGFALLIASGAVLLAALVVPFARPQLMPRVLATQGAIIVLVTTAFAFSCVHWATDKPGENSFHYLPGLIVVGMTYGAAQWAEFGWHGSRPRPWRLAGLVLGIALETIVAAFVIAALLST